MAHCAICQIQNDPTFLLLRQKFLSYLPITAPKVRRDALAEQTVNKTGTEQTVNKTGTNRERGTKREQNKNGERTGNKPGTLPA